MLPVLHEIIKVNMNTLRLVVARRNEQALITRDRMRVDVTAEFYLRVKPDQGAIAFAAQTLGRRTMSPDDLKELMEGKFVDALRAVAAEMGMEELHEKRTDFVQKVQNAVTADLEKNGLELESVSLTALDQTDKAFFQRRQCLRRPRSHQVNRDHRKQAQNQKRHRAKYIGRDSQKKTWKRKKSALNFRKKKTLPGPPSNGQSLTRRLRKQRKLLKRKPPTIGLQRKPISRLKDRFKPQKSRPTGK